jgi:pimeloyl-ACP methyl ester carboxylesterase
MKIKVLFIATLCTIQLVHAQNIVDGSNKGKYVKISGTDIYYEEYGKGFPVLLLEGGASSIKDFGKVIPDLAKKFRVIVPDSPGQGRSQQTDTLSYELLSDYFSKFIDQLRLDSLYVIGWSDGGIVGLLLAADNPEKVKRVIACGAQTGFIGDAKDKASLNSITPEHVKKEWGSWSSDYQAIAYKSNDWQEFIRDLVKMWGQDTMIPNNKIRNIKARTLIMLGDRDAITLEHGIEMYRSIAGSEFAVLPNTTHFVFTQRPEWFNQIGIEFLTRK